MPELDVRVRLTADGKGLVGELRVSREALDKLSGAEKRTGEAAKGAARDTGRLGAESRRAAAQSKRLASEQGNLARRINNSGRAARLLLTGLTGLSAVVVFRELGRQTLGFESSLARMVGLVGVAREQVQAWEQDILALGPATGRGPGELAEAMFFVTSAGQEGAGALEVLENAAKAAAVGLGSTVTVADLSTSALNVYGGAALDAATATGVLVATVREGKAAADQLASAMAPLLPIAQQMGVDFNQVGASMASMTQGGFSAAAAATAIQGALVGLTRESAEGAKELERVGLSYEGLRRTIRERGLLEGFQLLRDRLEGNETALVRVIGRVEGFNAVMSLTGENSEKVAEIFRVLAEERGQSLDAAFATVAETAQFKLNVAFAELNALLIEVGSETVPQVVDVFSGVLAVLRETSDPLDENVQLYRQLAAMIEVAVAAGAGLIALKLASVMVALATSTFRAAVAWRALGFAMRATPLGLLTTAIGLAAGAAVLLATRTSEAEEAQRRYNEVAERARGVIAALNGASGERAEQLRAEREELLRLARAEVAAAQARLEAAAAADPGRRRLAESFGAPRASLPEELVDVRERRRQLAQARAELLALQAMFGEFEGGRARLFERGPQAPAGGAGGGDDAAAAAALEELRKSFLRLEGAIDPAAKQQREFAAGMEIIRRAIAGGLIEDEARRVELVRALAKRYPEAAKAAGGLAAEQAALNAVAARGLEGAKAAAKALERRRELELEAALRRREALPLIEAQLKLIEDESRLAQLSERDRQIEIRTREVLDIARERGLELGEKELAQIKARVTAAVDDLERIEKSQRLQRQAAAEWERIWDNAASSIQASLAGAFRKALDGGIDSFEDFGAQVLSIMKDVAAEIAAALVFKAVLSPFGGPGGPGTSAGAGGAPLGFSPFDLFRQGNLASPGFNTGVIEGTLKLGGTVGQGITAANALGNLPFGTIGMAGAELFGLGGGLGGQLGGTLGSLIGGATPLGPVGAAIGGFIGSAIGGAIEDLFGGGPALATAGTLIPIIEGRAVVGDSQVANEGTSEASRAEAQRAAAMLNALVALGAELDRTGTNVNLAVVERGGEIIRSAEDVVRDAIEGGVVRGLDEEILNRIALDPEALIDPEFLGRLTALTNAYAESLSAAIQETQRMAQAFRSVAESLRASIDQLMIDPRLSPLSPEDRLTEAERIARETFEAAIGGDLDAAAALGGAVGDFLDASQGFYASGPGYQEDFAQALGWLEATADFADAEATTLEGVLSTLTASGDLNASLLAEQTAAIQAGDAAIVALLQALLAADAGILDFTTLNFPPLDEATREAMRRQWGPQIISLPPLDESLAMAVRGLEHGGIVTRPGVFAIAEGGRPEGVIPLDRPLETHDPRVAAEVEGLTREMATLNATTAAQSEEIARLTRAIERKNAALPGVGP